MNMQNKAIQVNGLKKSYKQLDVLKGVDFEVEKGSIFALLGCLAHAVGVFTPVY
jgi:ABC-2 type transport system ATP-binding protein